ncbi:2'-5' RNA ligase family protein [Rhizobium sp. PP-CC-3G-465]|uniref:2'-5' RNA ligase family protein n=1 Tax=Rhizobium sp. PP-CC-3G-465 TaxID=2135648 RepID=UPI00104BCE0B|nr:2'-5' RNA ligase [Rhizobium sp. PP-CC-3G-465]
MAESEDEQRDEARSADLDHRPLIVTVEMEAAAQAHFDHLRSRYFPPERNWLSAHITLFHALPGKEREAIAQHLAQAVAGRSPITVTVERVRFLGNGVAFVLSSPALQGLRALLAKRFQPWLTRQDEQGFRPHVTVQNKVPAETARALQATLSEDFAPWDFTVTGLSLWHYDGGPWEKTARFPLS